MEDVEGLAGWLSLSPWPWRGMPVPGPNQGPIQGMGCR